MARTRKPTEPSADVPEDAVPGVAVPEDAVPEDTPTAPIDVAGFDATPTEALFPAASPQSPDGPEPERGPSLFHRHPIAWGIAGAAVAVVLISGLTAWGVGAAVTASLTSSTSSMAPMSSGAAASGASTGAGKAGKLRSALGGRIVFAGTIESIDGSTWTVSTRSGRTATVTIASTTQFGTRMTPATAADFSVGDSVRVIGTRMTGSALSGTATRVIRGAAATGSGVPTSPATTEPTPQT